MLAAKIPGMQPASGSGAQAIFCSFASAYHLRHQGPVAMGISLWLPPGNVDGYARMQGLISELSARHSSPLFAPHITLCTVPSNTPNYLERLKDACAGLPKQDVKFDAVETGGTFFQSVFIAVHPSAALVELKKAIFERLGLPDADMPRFPHMSLYYGDERKQEIRDRLYEDGTVETLPEGGVFVGGSKGWPVNEIWIARCEGEVKTWEILAKVPLV
ncbi:LigT-like protein [Auricularia subglabra TFB-10046 SS5]|nr:LigT-like protein [Auricularia subglabra TFB-10046 SS5]